MIETQYTLSTGEIIYIFDNVFAYSDVERIRSYVEHSPYRLGRISNTTLNSVDQNTFFQTDYTKSDIDRLKLFDNTNFANIFQKYLSDQTLHRSWVNVSTYLTDFRFHPDSYIAGNKSLLYYVNTKWNEDWGGETLFKNSNGDVEKAVEFKPNRMVIFNNNIGHRAAQVALNADMYRFILVLQFKLSQKEGGYKVL